MLALASRVIEISLNLEFSRIIGRLRFDYSVFGASKVIHIRSLFKFQHSFVVSRRDFSTILQKKCNPLAIGTPSSNRTEL